MEAKFTLNEAFDILYEEVLEEQLSEDIKSLTLDLDENQNQLMESLDILLEIGAAASTSTGTENGDKDDKSKDKKNDQSINVNLNGLDSGNAFQQALDLYDKMYDRAEKRAKTEYELKNDREMTIYAPVSRGQEIQRIGDMKFPENIIFFITQLVKWIKNNILNFIDKFSNIVRSLLGLEATKSHFDQKDLKLKLARVKDIESRYLVDLDSAYDVDQRKSFKNVLNKGEALKKDQISTRMGDLVNGGFDAAKARQLISATRPVEIIPIDYKDAEFLRENLDITFDEPLNEAYEGDVKTIRLDTSHDLFALRESLQHFFDLFDNAFGSNDEKLFSIDDLEIMLNLFKTTIRSITDPSVVALNGDLSFSTDAISAAKLKDNLLRTKVNTDNLKYAYVTTNKQINVLAQIIMNKNLMGASQMGASFAFLSAATYEQMIEILDIIDERLKEAKRMEVKLQKMKKSYEKLVDMLDSGRTKLSSVKGITFTTSIQKRINELYDGARYMTQTVQLRLNTLALYISELNDTRSILKNLNAIPEASYKQHGNLFVKLKKLFKK